jgi:hypothetical protein
MVLPDKLLNRSFPQFGQTWVLFVAPDITSPQIYSNDLPNASTTSVLFKFVIRLPGATPPIIRLVR